MMTYFRVLHDREYQPLWRWGVPEVFHFDQHAPVRLTEAWQELIFSMNPGMDGQGFRSLLAYNRAFTNGTGFDGNPARADYINRLNLDKKLPLLDKARVCGGAKIKGTVIRNTVTILTLDGRRPPPPLSYVLACPWLYFEAITVRSDGSNGRFPQNGGEPVLMPLVAGGGVTVKLRPPRDKMPYPFLEEV
jgi:hypothetical protein